MKILCIVFLDYGLLLFYYNYYTMCQGHGFHFSITTFLKFLCFCIYFIQRVIFDFLTISTPLVLHYKYEEIKCVKYIYFYFNYINKSVLCTPHQKLIMI
jgi:hypothetical protein